MAINKQEVARYCRILGVNATASISDIKYARSRLAKLYHPDKHTNVSFEAQKLIKEKFQLVQEAYEFLVKNNDVIEQQFQHLEEFSLTSKGNVLNRSHWVYKTVEACC